MHVAMQSVVDGGFGAHHCGEFAAGWRNGYSICVLELVGRWSAVPLRRAYVCDHLHGELHDAILSDHLGQRGRRDQPRERMVQQRRGGIGERNAE